MTSSADARGPAAALPFRLDTSGCLSPAAGVGGLDVEALESWLRRLDPHLARVQQDLAAGRLPVLDIVDAADDIAEAEAALRRLSEGAETIVFLGTGGSSLGGQALAQVAGWNIPGDGGPEHRKGPRTRFYDNLDPRTLQCALESLDLARSRFVVTSKSGGTAETLVQAICAVDAVRRAGLESRIGSMFLGLTEPDGGRDTNPLRRLCRRYSVPVLDHHTGIGGRFSALSNVGLLPALSRALDVRAVRAGAKAVVEQLRSARSAAEVAPAIGAAVTVGLMRDRGVRTLVLLPYCDRLESLAEWWVQLWAESLGKDGQGSSPVAALGPVDQHSQLQLWMDGPREHLITQVRVRTAGEGPVVDAELARLTALDMLAGRRVGDLVDAQAHATPQALAEAGRPVRIIEVDRLDERAVGGLMMHFIVETILSAALLGVDPFGQPAVELGKRIAKERLERGA